MANKIKYGLSNVHYAVATIGVNNTATYATPVALAGAVNLSLEPQGEATTFYADNVAYWIGGGNDGYSGDLEVALVSEAFKKDILGEIEDDKDVLFEDQDAATVHFALLFQFEGDSKATKHVIYNCTVSRMNLTGATREESVEPQTETLSITAKSIYNNTLDKNLVKSSTMDTTDSTTYSQWYSSVYIPTVTP